MEKEERRKLQKYGDRKEKTSVESNSDTVKVDAKEWISAEIVNRWQWRKTGYDFLEPKEFIIDEADG